MPARLLVRELIDAYLRHSQSETLHCSAALKEREFTLGLFAALHGESCCDDMRAFHLRDFITAHAPRWRARSTRKHKANQIRALFQWGVNEERIDRNPFRSVKFEDSDRRPDMADESFDQLCGVADPPFRRVLQFLRLTGCRLSEMCRADWEDLDLDAGVWVIHKHKSYRYTRKPKIVALVNEVVELLRAMGPSTGPVFLTQRGRRWTKNHLVQHYQRVKTRHRICTDATLHGLRHRFGSAAIAAGAPLKLISAQLGHASAIITERYYVSLTGEIEAIRGAAELARPTRIA